MFEAVIALVSIFVAYTLRKTDLKIEETARVLSLHKLESAAVHSAIRSEVSKEFSTKLELQATERRITDAHREIQIKLDRLIDRLIDNPK